MNHETAFAKAKGRIAAAVLSPAAGPNDQGWPGSRPKAIYLRLAAGPVVRAEGAKRADSSGGPGPWPEKRPQR